MGGENRNGAGGWERGGLPSQSYFECSELTRWNFVVLTQLRIHTGTEEKPSVNGNGVLMEEACGGLLVSCSDEGTAEEKFGPTGT